tara:strand:+ start:184 stop:396 length:213 start_codon:yes stop_codon:yes gene_type:complete
MALGYGKGGMMIGAYRGANCPIVARRRQKRMAYNAKAKAYLDRAIECRDGSYAQECALERAAFYEWCSWQ